MDDMEPEERDTVAKAMNLAGRFHKTAEDFIYSNSLGGRKSWIVVLTAAQILGRQLEEEFKNEIPPAP